MNRDKQIEEMADALRTLDTLQYNPNYTVNYQRAVGLHSLGYRKQAEWISVNDGLPEDGEAVLIWVGKVQVARIYKGITEEEREKMKNGELPNPSETAWSSSTGYVSIKRSETYRRCDVFGNNSVPYCWESTSGPMKWFGQNVSYWMPLPNAPKESRTMGSPNRERR